VSHCDVARCFGQEHFGNGRFRNIHSGNKAFW